MNKFTVMLLLTVLIAADASACKKSGNRANVTAMDEGRYYARSIPDSDLGFEGKTDIYLVGINEDQKIDSYNWFNRNKLVLAWSPKVGKVGVLRYDPENEDAALSFYMGGNFLKSYSHGDLNKLGIKSIKHYCGTHLDLKILGQEQIPNTNDYAFKIGLEPAGIKIFDITTGEIFKATAQASAK